LRHATPRNTPQVHKALSKDVEDARRHVERGVRRDLEFDVAGAVAAVCSLRNDDYERFSAELRRFCESELTARPEHVAVFTRAFSGAAPAAANLFRRKGQICGELQPECRTLELQQQQQQPLEGGPSGGSGHSRLRLPSRCAACAAFVGDTWSELRRWSQADPFFLSPAHVERVLEEACGAAAGRHPAAVAQQVDAVCEELMEDSDAELLGAFVGFKGDFGRAILREVEEQQEEERQPQENNNGEEDEDERKWRQEEQQGSGRREEGRAAAGAGLDELVRRVCVQLAGMCEGPRVASARGSRAAEL
jgi:hypothetical protein